MGLAAAAVRKRWAQDPYLEWAQLTHARYLRAGPAGPWRLAVTAETARQMDATARRALRLPGSKDSWSAVPAWLVQGAELQQVVRHLPGILLTEPGMRALSEPAANRCLPPIAGVSSRALVGGELVLGVIDGRCGFLNQQFASARGSRIAAYWDQGTNASVELPSWRTPSDKGYGRELLAAELDAVLSASGLNQPNLSPVARQALERQAYRALQFALPADADWSHGTHVLNTVLSDFDQWRRQIQAEAPEPRVIFVQTPDDALTDTSGRWMASHVLDALDYILARAGATSKVVVNISLGAFAGPHDGSSLVERGIDERIRTRKGRLTVVVAAGNAGRITDDGTGHQAYCHRHLRIEPGKTVELSFQLDIDDATESFIELWAPAGSGLTLRLVQAVAGLDSRWVGPACTSSLERQGEVVAAVVNASGQATARGEGDHALVALGHTRSVRSEAVAPTGRWLLQVRNPGPHAVTADAWFERRDMPGELPGYRPQYGFMPSLSERSEAMQRQDQLSSGLKLTPARPPVSPVGTGNLCSLANGQRTLVVGALDESGVPAEYGSTGPSRLHREVDVFAMGEREGAGFLTGSRKELRGTSMAAALVSAALLAGADRVPGAAGTTLNKLQRRARRRGEGKNSKGVIKLPRPAEGAAIVAAALPHLALSVGGEPIDKAQLGAD